MSRCKDGQLWEDKDYKKNKKEEQKMKNRLRKNGAYIGITLLILTGIAYASGSIWTSNPILYLNGSVSLPSGSLTVTGDVNASNVIYAPSVIADTIQAGGGGTKGTVNSTHLVTPESEFFFDSTVAGGNFTFLDLTSCDTIDTDANGRLKCGSDSTGGVFDVIGDTASLDTTQVHNLNISEGNLTVQGDAIFLPEGRNFYWRFGTPDTADPDQYMRFNVRHGATVNFLQYRLQAPDGTSQLTFSVYNATNSGYASQNGMAEIRVASTVNKSLLIRADEGIILRNAADNDWTRILADDFVDMSPKELEEQLHKENKKADEYTLKQVNGVLDLSNAPSSAFGTYRDSGYLEDGTFYDNGVKYYVKVGEGVVWNSLKIDAVDEKNKALKNQVNILYIMNLGLIGAVSFLAYQTGYINLPKFTNKKLILNYNIWKGG